MYALQLWWNEISGSADYVSIHLRAFEKLQRNKAQLSLAHDAFKRELIS